MSTIHGLLVRMGDAGERVSRWGTPAGLAALAALTLVLSQSIFWAEHVPWLLKLGIAVVAAITFANAGNGLLIVAGLTPLGYMLAA